MKYFYPDINAFQFTREIWSPSDFRDRCQSADCKLALGTHVMYELFRSVNKGNVGIAQVSFRFLSEIKTSIELVPTINEVIRAEFDFAQFGTPMITVVGPINQITYWEPIEKGVLGHFEEAKQFISKRECEIANEEPRIAKHNEKVFGEMTSPEQRKKMKVFEGFKQELLPTLGPGYLRNLAALPQSRVHILPQSDTQGL